MKCVEDERTGVRCANEGCARETEPGERYCVSCGLERTLYKREARRPAPTSSSRRPALDSLGPSGDASSPRRAPVEPGRQAERR